MKYFLIITIVFLLLVACTEKKESLKPKIVNEVSSNFSGSELAQSHCIKCHILVNPEILTKSIWKNDVLPNMGNRMGIYENNKQRESLLDPENSGEMMRKANIFPKKPTLSKSDWDKIVTYYVENSPDSILSPVRNKKIKMGLKHFKYKEADFALRPALTVMVKILPKNKGFVFSDSRGKSSSLNLLNANLKINYKMDLAKTPVHYYEKSDKVFLTSIGKNLFPTDDTQGELQKINTQGDKLTTVISNLQRPVFMVYGDLNNNGLEDIVICEFGNQTGKLSWYENKGNNEYTSNVLQSKPGAIKAIIKDINKDGLNDIIALMAQGDEGIFYYENRGDGFFIEKRLLSFSPLNGSQNMELIDMNKDGFDDIVYVCGDNADKSPILKNYHGVYIYLNNGDLNFKQTYFYQLNGAYKAMVNDYDLDGDMDIAAISFFPDYVSYPEESFVYLENKGNLKFTDYSFPESTNGRWIVMDAADMDGDGDVDLALGSFVYFVAKGDTTGLGKKWFEEGPSMIVLENTTR